MAVEDEDKRFDELVAVHAAASLVMRNPNDWIFHTEVRALGNMTPLHAILQGRYEDVMSLIDPLLDMGAS